jgi:tetratricopeptide (TPR) repeat protein
MIRRNEDSSDLTIEELNRLAMLQLTSEKYNHTSAYLNQALFKIRLMPESHKKNSLLALTYNNLGCFYKRLGQVDQALDYFFQSLDFENSGGGVSENIANTNLNISVLLSLKNEHERSLRYAIKAHMILKREYRSNPSLIVSIINCYLRIGIEYKSLSQLSQALTCFKKGYEICTKVKNQASSGLKKTFKEMYIETLAEMGEKKPNPISKAKARLKSHSPKSTVDSHTTAWSQSTSNKPFTPRHLEKPVTSHFRRKSLVLPPMEEFSLARKSYLGNIYEMEESKKKKINSKKLRDQERLAAVLIQAHWKGFLQRRKFQTMLICKKIKEAESRARKAIDEVKNLKTLAQSRVLNRGRKSRN